MNKIIELVEEIESWTDGDLSALKQSNGDSFGAGEVPFDGTFVFENRKKILNELKDLVKKFEK